MELADCRARMQGQNSSTWTAEAMAEYNEVGRKMGQQFYRVAGFMNENDRNQLMSQSGFHWEP